MSARTVELVVQPLRVLYHDGRAYDPGQAVCVTQAEAKTLLEAGVATKTGKR